MNNARLYYVDWLRVIIILSLIPYHAALTYTGLGEIYIKNVTTGLKLIPFLIITVPLDNFFMTLLFFLAGISSYYSLQFRNKTEYIKERFQKLLIPLILGTIFLCPLQAYFKVLYYGFQGNYFEFLPEFFSEKIIDYLGYAHLWFLLYLFIFSLICYPLFIMLIENRSIYLKITDFIVYKKNIYISMVWIITVEILLRPFFPGMQTLVMDWANDIVYISVYIFGFIYASDHRIQDKLDKMFSKAILIVLISLITLFGIYYYWLIYNGNRFFVTTIWAFYKGIYESFMIVMLLGFGRRYLNNNSRILKYLNKASFTYYVFHLLPVSLLTYLIIDMKINEYIKYFITVIFSFILTGAIYELIKHTSLGLRKKRRDL